MSEAKRGSLYGVGVGPGDPELLTLKALRVIQGVEVIAYPAAQHGRSNARNIVAAQLRPEQIELPLIFPITTEPVECAEEYERSLSAFYDQSAERIAARRAWMSSTNFSVKLLPRRFAWQ